MEQHSSCSYNYPQPYTLNPKPNKVLQGHGSQALDGVPAPYFTAETWATGSGGLDSFHDYRFRV